MNIRTRLFHLAALVLGALTIALALLEKLPKYAAVAGSLLLVIANVEKMSPALVDAIKKIFPSSVTPAGLLGILVARSLAVFAIVAMLFTSCATLSNCKPTTEDGIQIVADLSLDNYESVLEQYAISRGVCLVNNAVSDFVTAHRPDAAAPAASLKAEDGPALVHGEAWLAKHRGQALLCGTARPS